MVDQNPTRSPVDVRIARIAAGQFGCITAGQLMATGLSRGAIQGRVRSGRIFRVHSGVYRVGHDESNDEQRFMAAVLAVGADAALCDLTCAFVRGLWKRSRIDVVQVVCGRRVDVPRITIKFSRHWDADVDIRFVNGLPCTTVERMALDLGCSLTRYQLTNVLKEAAFQGAFDPAALEREMQRLGGRAGTVVARQALESFARGCTGTRSALEDRFVRLVEIARLPAPDDAGVPVGPHEVDLVWTRQRLIVEVDGPGHRQPNSRRKDPARDADLRSAGFEVVRFSNRDIDTRQIEVVRLLERCLQREELAG